MHLLVTVTLRNGREFTYRDKSGRPLAPGDRVNVPRNGVLGAGWEEVEVLAVREEDD